MAVTLANAVEWLTSNAQEGGPDAALRKEHARYFRAAFTHMGLDENQPLADYLTSVCEDALTWVRRLPPTMVGVPTLKKAVGSVNAVMRHPSVVAALGEDRLMEITRGISGALRGGKLDAVSRERRQGGAGAEEETDEVAVADGLIEHESPPQREGGAMAATQTQARLDKLREVTHSIIDAFRGGPSCSDGMARVLHDLVDIV